MDDEDLIATALRAALDHLLAVDGQAPMSDEEWAERPTEDPLLFAALISAGRKVLGIARKHGHDIPGEIPATHLSIANGAKRGRVRVRHIPTGIVVEVGHLNHEANRALALRMVRAALDAHP